MNCIEIAFYICCLLKVCVGASKAESGYIYLKELGYEQTCYNANRISYGNSFGYCNMVYWSTANTYKRDNDPYYKSIDKFQRASFLVSKAIINPPRYKLQAFRSFLYN